MITIAAILDAHRSGRATPEETIAQCYARIRAHGDPAIFITLRDERDVILEAKALAGAGGKPPALGYPGGGQGQYRRQRFACRTLDCVSVFALTVMPSRKVPPQSKVSGLKLRVSAPRK